jgi:lysozyme
MPEQGIDVGWPQGARYNWHQWAGKISFGMCKATEGLDIIDPDIGDNWDAMWNLHPDHRLPRFAYHFFHPKDDPGAQARHFVSTVREHGLLPGDNLVADLETSDGLPPWKVASRAAQFMGICNGLAPNHRVLAYTNPGFADDGNCHGLAAWHLWIANYGVLHPHVPAPWDTWTFWQAGENPVDTDRFNGTHGQLLAFCRMPTKSR